MQAFLTGLFAVASSQASIGCYPFGAGRTGECARFINDFCGIVSKDQVRIVQIEKSPSFAHTKFRFTLLSPVAIVTICKTPPSSVFI